MNPKLLEKIEESTLYTIELEKKLKVQQDKNKEVEEQLARVEILLNKNK